MKQDKDLIVQPATLKKILKADKEVGKVSQPVYKLMATAMDMFIQDLLGKMLSGDSLELTPELLENVIKNDPHYDFLLSLLPKIEEIKTNPSIEKKRSKKSLEEE